MNWLILLGIGAGVVLLTWVLDRMGVVDLSNKAARGGSSGGVLMMMDEVFAPTKTEAQAGYDRQTSLPVPAPSPAGGDHDLLSGRVLIQVPAVRTADRGPARVGTHERSY